MLYTVNIIDIEQALLALEGKAQARDIQDWVMQNRCAGLVPENYQHERSFRQTIQRKIEDYCPDAEGFDVLKREPKFRRIERGVYRFTGNSFGDSQLPEELPGSAKYREGTVKKIFVNSYERDKKARKACIDHYGMKCRVCDFDFEEFYGPLGKAYIHVHHIIPLHLIGATYQVDPIKHLLPVCPNCHAMLHQSDPPLEPSALREILLERRRLRRKAA
jgi:predicted HNH restriction endonuclease